MTFSSIWIGMQDFTARPPCERAISRASSRTSCDIEDGLIEPGILKSDFVSVAANPAVKPGRKGLLSLAGVAALVSRTARRRGSGVPEGDQASGSMPWKPCRARLYRVEDGRFFG
jgi:hypothetical protein